jgi:transcriptional regulator with XRE-family HTH domain
MHNAKSGARTHHRGTQKDGEVLSPSEAAVKLRGQILKRYVRAAAAMNDLFDDAALADAVGIGRGAIAGWWRGAQPSGQTIFRLAAVTGLSADELTRFVYDDGGPPSLPAPGSWTASSVQEGLRRDQSHQPLEDPEPPLPSPGRQPRGSGAGRA